MSKLLENTDNMWKYLASNRKQGGFINRIYERENVSLFCSIEERDANDEEKDAFWTGDFYVFGSNEPIRFYGSWDKMVNKFDEIFINNKTNQTKIIF